MKIHLAFLSLAVLASASPFAARSLQKRDLEKCKTLQQDSNNGGRKVAIVVDESGSMFSSDPYNLRKDAAKALNDWLISDKEAGDGKKADEVAVIGFDDTTRLLYGLGDPSGADKVFDQITDLGGTYISLGVDEGMNQITTSGHDPTANRSAIVVLTDGEDYDTLALVESIDKAGQLGIRVSFGFLQAYGYSYQDPDVLKAIKGTGGMYATIDGFNAQNMFVNAMIVNGLTDNDNASPNANTTVYNGLSIAFIIDGSGTNTLTYTAQSNEKLTFTITSVSAGELNVTATDGGGKELNTTSVAETSYLPEELSVRAAGDGTLQLKIEGEPNQQDAIFIVGVNSSIPLTNCTLGNPKKEGLSTGAKAGIGVAVPLIAGLAGLGSYFLWKYWKGIPPKGAPGSSAPPGGNEPPLDYKQPYVQTMDLPTPSPQPLAPNAQPGWAFPPMIPPKFHSPGKPGNQSDHPDHTSEKPNYHHNSTGPQQPDYNSPNQQPINPQDPSHPSGSDLHAPNAQDPTHPSQFDPQHPSQADPSHPTQADPSHPTQADPSHPTQADPSHPTQADPSHPTQADPSDPNSPPNTNSDPSQPTDPNQNPNAPPNDPFHPKRLPQTRTQSRFPRLPFGRRRKKDEEEKQDQQAQYVGVGSVTMPPSAQSSQPQRPSYFSAAYWTSSVTTPPNHVSTAASGYGNGQQKQHGGFAQQSFGHGAPQQYSYSHSYNTPQPQYAVPGQVYSTQQYGTPVNSPPQQYATTVSAMQQFPRPPTAGPEDVNRTQYNVSPVDHHAELSSPVPIATQSSPEDTIRPINTGSMGRRPVGQ